MPKKARTQAAVERGSNPRKSAAVRQSRHSEPADVNPAGAVVLASATSDLAGRACALLVDSERRDAREVADELAGLLASPPRTWLERIPEVLGRKLTQAEAAAVRRLQRAPADRLAHTEVAHAIATKMNDTR